MITDELKHAVKTEAALLRKHGQPEELAQINFSDLDPFNAQCCIYGMATGDCFSERAMDLFEKCAIPFSKSNVEFIEPEINTFCDVKPLTEDEVGEDLTRSQARGYNGYSAIEFYITQDGAKHEELTNFLSGKANTLNI